MHKHTSVQLVSLLMAYKRILRVASLGAAAAISSALSIARALGPSEGEQYYTPRNTRKIIASALSPGVAAGAGNLFETETGVPVERGRELLNNMVLFAGSSNPSL
jgi:hypothetical protein